MYHTKNTIIFHIIPIKIETYNISEHTFPYVPRNIWIPSRSRPVKSAKYICTTFAHTHTRDIHGNANPFVTVQFIYFSQYCIFTALYCVCVQVETPPTQYIIRLNEIERSLFTIDSKTLLQLHLCIEFIFAKSYLNAIRFIVVRRNKCLIYICICCALIQFGYIRLKAILVRCQIAKNRVATCRIFLK